MQSHAVPNIEHLASRVFWHFSGLAKDCGQDCVNNMQLHNLTFVANLLWQFNTAMKTLVDELPLKTARGVCYQHVAADDDASDTVTPAHKRWLVAVWAVFLRGEIDVVSLVTRSESYKRAHIGQSVAVLAKSRQPSADELKACEVVTEDYFCNQPACGDIIYEIPENEFNEEFGEVVANGLCPEIPFCDPQFLRSHRQHV